MVNEIENTQESITGLEALEMRWMKKITKPEGVGLQGDS